MNIRFEKLLSLLGKKRLFFDGGTGTMLESACRKFGVTPCELCLSSPEDVLSLHKRYIKAGANILETNTFGAYAHKYENWRDIVKAGVTLARKAADESRRDEVFVALDVAPLGKLLKPYGDLPFDDAVEIFKEFISVGAEAGVDLILPVTMSDAFETKAAVLAAKEVSELPVFVLNSYDASGRLLTGATPRVMITTLEGLGVDAVGVNCSTGPDGMKSVVEDYLNYSHLPVIVNPNAGLPIIENGNTVYRMTPDGFAEEMKNICRNGVSVLGGCCGTTPDMIDALVKAYDNVPLIGSDVRTLPTVTSGQKFVEIGRSPVVIGERINPTGKKRLKDALRKKEYSVIYEDALAEESAGADILDINAGLPDIDEAKTLYEVMSGVEAICPLPLQIDTVDPEALELCLRHYNGKALINSVSGKTESMNTVFPLMKKYGGVCVTLTLDENGIPTTAEGRFAIACRILTEAKKYGFTADDFLFDPLTMAVSADTYAADTVLDTLDLMKKAGLRTVLGISNVSFGLPERDKLTATFLSEALSHGLSAMIMNPNSDIVMGTVRAYRALHGYDSHFCDYLTTYAETKGSKTDSGVKPADTSLSLRECIEKGLADRAKTATEEAIKETDPLMIISEQIIPALNSIGDAYGKGTAYLPELLMSADAAEKAFGVLRSVMPAKIASDYPPIVLATVRGDVHDIGKNIVKTLLENYGFTVIDLGKDVPAEVVAKTAAENQAKLVGLSALMTTTVPSMKETICLVKKTVPDCKIIVGGAVLTETIAENIGADAYGKDAMQTVRYAQSLFGEQKG